MMKTLRVRVARLERRAEEGHGPGAPTDPWARVLSELRGSGTWAQVRIWRKAMPLPDPNANEPTVELDQDKVKLLNEAKDAIVKWTKHYNRLKQELMAILGDATAGTVDGVKVIYYRPKDQYALTRLESDYPDLVEHFKKAQVTEILDVEAFKAQHSDILEKYRVRAFVERVT